MKRASVLALLGALLGAVRWLTEPTGSIETLAVRADPDPQEDS